MDVGAGVTLGVSWNADTIYDLEGGSVQGGASGGPGWYVGGDIICFDDSDTAPDGLQLTGGIGAGVDIHVNHTKTERTLTLLGSRPDDTGDSPKSTLKKSHINRVEYVKKDVPVINSYKYNPSYGANYLGYRHGQYGTW